MLTCRFLTLVFALALASQGAVAAQGQRTRRGSGTRVQSQIVVVAPVGRADEKEVRRLVELTGVVEKEMASVEPILAEWKRQTPQVPEKVWEEVRAEFKKSFTREMITEMYVSIYTRHFDTADVRKLIAFYASPVGRKLVAQTPQMEAEAYMGGLERGIKLGERIREMLKAKGYNVPST